MCDFEMPTFEHLTGNIPKYLTIGCQEPLKLDSV
jgi:hypothetical protein